MANWEQTCGFVANNSSATIWGKPVSWRSRSLSNGSTRALFIKLYHQRLWDCETDVSWAIQHLVIYDDLSLDGSFPTLLVHPVVWLLFKVKYFQLKSAKWFWRSDVSPMNHLYKENLHYNCFLIHSLDQSFKSSANILYSPLFFILNKRCLY